MKNKLERQEKTLYLIRKLINILKLFYCYYTVLLTILLMFAKIYLNEPFPDELLFEIRFAGELGLIVIGNFIIFENTEKYKIKYIQILTFIMLTFWYKNPINEYVEYLFAFAVVQLILAILLLKIRDINIYKILVYALLLFLSLVIIGMDNYGLYVVVFFMFGILYIKQEENNKNNIENRLLSIFILMPMLCLKSFEIFFSIIF